MSTVRPSSRSKTRWKLRRGDVFDTTYPERFMKTDGREELQRIAVAWQRHKANVHRRSATRLYLIDRTVARRDGWNSRTLIDGDEH